MKRFYYLITLLLASSAVAFGVEENYVFTDSDSAQGWTSVDSDGDGVTWGVTPDLSGIAYLGNTTTSSADDWLFSPAISLEANKDYILEYAVSLRGVFGDVTVEVVEGTSADDAQSLSHEVYSHHSGIVTRRSHVTIGDRGTLSVGFHLQMPPANGVVSLKSVKIIETTPQKPESVPAMALVPMSGEKKVKVKWINPVYDCDGARIRGELYADILAGDYDYPILIPYEPGQECEYVITPAIYAGSLTVGLSVFQL
ncbi:MAG: choice-of-anchor J domain-containing protein [Muribaculaceae bacterium]